MDCLNLEKIEFFTNPHLGCPASCNWGCNWDLRCSWAPNSEYPFPAQCIEKTYTEAGIRVFRISITGAPGHFLLDFEQKFFFNSDFANDSSD
jgi:hypothetical protein